jgi:4-amino-4-deoxy-L-arabinose transferase-like glycosyltransferase
MDWISQKIILWDLGYEPRSWKKAGVEQPMTLDRTGIITLCLLTALLWGINIAWLGLDTRPPVWDMALHQTYALNYLSGTHASSGEMPKPWERSGNYPPFVHLVIAAVFLLFHPGPHIAVLANIPATIILLWAIYSLAKDIAGPDAGPWACLLAILTPYAIWISRETVLDYWLSAWFAAALVLVRKNREFQSRNLSLILGAVLALGLLTKWFFAGILFIPLVYVFIAGRMWRYPARLINFADMLLVAGVVAGLWYLPNLPRLVRYFGENTAVGAAEGEPPVLSFQSFIYYLRLLEGYQLFAILFVILCLACVFVWRNKLVSDGRFLVFSIAGGWLIMTLLRTKDPRFTLPLIGPLCVISGAWIGSWKKTVLNRAVQALIIALLAFQAFMSNFGVSWMPNRVVILPGYQGTYRWDWNLYLQSYFDIWGKPRKEDWKQDEILRKIEEDSNQKKVQPSLALVPDLAWFSEGNFALYAKMRRLPIRIHHLTSAAEGIHSFDGYNYILMTEHDQGMSWTTGASSVLNQIIVDNPQVFRLVQVYQLPSGDGARLYYLEDSRRSAVGSKENRDNAILR